VDKDSHLIFERYLHNEPMNEGLKDVLAAGALGLASLAGPNKDIQAGSKAPQELNINRYANAAEDPAFVQYIMNVENAGKTGFKGGKWFPHPSPEGGTDTIAYGHKLKGGENFSRGISQNQAIQLLKSDLNEAAGYAKNAVDKRFTKGTYDRLDNQRKQMLIDYIFNLGPKALGVFKDFTNAVINNDKSTALREYKRKYKPKDSNEYKDLTRRNNLFKKHFLDNWGKGGNVSAQSYESEGKPGTRNADEKIIIVSQGDTLSGIAKKRGITLQQLFDANPQLDTKEKRNRISIGQKIKLP